MICNQHSQVSDLDTLIWHWSNGETLLHSQLSVNSLTGGQQQDGQNPTWWSQTLELERLSISICDWPKGKSFLSFDFGGRRTLLCGHQDFDRETKNLSMSNCFSSPWAKVPLLFLVLLETAVDRWNVALYSIWKKNLWHHKFDLTTSVFQEQNVTLGISKQWHSKGSMMH